MDREAFSSSIDRTLKVVLVAGCCKLARQSRPIALRFDAVGSAADRWHQRLEAEHVLAK